MTHDGEAAGRRPVRVEAGEKGPWVSVYSEPNGCALGLDVLPVTRAWVLGLDNNGRGESPNVHSHYWCKGVCRSVVFAMFVGHIHVETWKHVFLFDFSVHVSLFLF